MSPAAPAIHGPWQEAWNCQRGFSVENRKYNLSSLVEGKQQSGLINLIKQTNKKVIMNTIVSKHDLHYFWSQPTAQCHLCSGTRSSGFVPAAPGTGMPSRISLLAAGTEFKHVSCHHICKRRQMYYAVTAGSIKGWHWVSSSGQRALWHGPGTSGLPRHHCPAAACPARPCPGAAEASEWAWPRRAVAEQPPPRGLGAFRHRAQLHILSRSEFPLGPALLRALCVTLAFSLFS